MRPKTNGDRSEVVREGADGLTPGAEEMDTQKAYINLDHIGKTKFGDPLDWCAC